jgi:Na+:H+ antiporter, NhaA family
MPPDEQPPRSRRTIAAAPWRAERWGGALARVADAEAASGIVVALAVAAALLWTNTPLRSSYAVWNDSAHWGALPAPLFGTVRDLVNNGLMTVFFFAIGLELGRERAVGALQDTRSALAPTVAALGGMAGAALAYLVTASALGAPGVVLRAWGTPMATDVAFTLGAMAMLGRAVPNSLRVFVLALAVADDVASVVVLAFVSPASIHPWPLLGAAAVVAVVFWRRRTTRRWPYLVVVAGTWLLLARGGVEPALAGVLVGVLVPWDTPGAAEVETGSSRLELGVVRLSAFVVLPVFVLANSGVTLTSSLWSDRSARTVGVAILVARLLGKIAGITLAVVVLVRLGVAGLPDGVRWRQLTGAAALCGIGFTVPLLFASLTLGGHPQLIGAVRASLLVASGLAFVIGAALLVPGSRRPAPEQQGETTTGADRGPAPLGELD